MLSFLLKQKERKEMIWWLGRKAGSNNVPRFLGLEILNVCIGFGEGMRGMAM